MKLGRNRRARDSTRLALLQGAGVSLDAHLRRTSSRGWGAWTPVRLAFEPLPDGAVRWRAEDPVAVGLPAAHGSVDATFGEVADLWTRGVRFRTEAFWGLEADIVVLGSERTTTELAVAPDLLPALLPRLRAQLHLDSVEGGPGGR